MHLIVWGERRFNKLWEIGVGKIWSDLNMVEGNSKMQTKQKQIL